MKLRADLKLVKQLDYIPHEYVDFSGTKCAGCVFCATKAEDNSVCERINKDELTCSYNKIWVIDEKQWNSLREIR